MDGKSTVGSAATGSIRYPSSPSKTTATISKVVAIGRTINGAETFIPRWIIRKIVTWLFGDDLYLAPGLEIILALDDDLFAALQSPVQQGGVAERLFDGNGSRLRGVIWLDQPYKVALRTVPDRRSGNGHTIVPLFDHHPAIGETSRPQLESLIGKAGLEFDRSGRRTTSLLTVCTVPRSSSVLPFSAYAYTGSLFNPCETPAAASSVAASVMIT